MWSKADDTLYVFFVQELLCLEAAHYLNVTLGYTTQVQWF